MAQRGGDTSAFRSRHFVRSVDPASVERSVVFLKHRPLERGAASFGRPGRCQGEMRDYSALGAPSIRTLRKFVGRPICATISPFARPAGRSQSPMATRGSLRHAAHDRKEALAHHRVPPKLKNSRKTKQLCGLLNQCLSQKARVSQKKPGTVPGTESPVPGTRHALTDRRQV